MNDDDYFGKRLVFSLFLVLFFSPLRRFVSNRRSADLDWFGRCYSEREENDDDEHEELCTSEQMDVVNDDRSEKENVEDVICLFVGLFKKNTQTHTQ